MISSREGFDVPSRVSGEWSALGDWRYMAASQHAVRTAVGPYLGTSDPAIYLFENRRSRNISPNEIYRFTTPIPLIAPRTYMFPQY